MSVSDGADQKAVEARFFDGRTTRAHVVRVWLDAGMLRAQGDTLMSEWPLTDVRITARLGSAPRRIELPQGAFIEVPDSPLWDELAERAGHKIDWVAALEKRWRYAAASLIVVVLSGVACYIWGLPLAARVIAGTLPEPWIYAASQGAMETLDKLMLDPSKLPPSRQKELTDAFARWSAPTETRPGYTLHFRHGAGIGANALALPSGDIVVTDQLVELAKDDREILGVLAHELGHLHHRHSLRQIVQASVVTFAAVWWFGDAGDVAGASSALLTLRYSRDFEREADDYAASMMLKNHVDPRRLGDMLTRLGEAHGGSGHKSTGKEEADEDDSDYFQTHPLTKERMDRLTRHALGAREAAE